MLEGFPHPLHHSQTHYYQQILNLKKISILINLVLIMAPKGGLSYIWSLNNFWEWILSCLIYTEFCSWSSWSYYPPKCTFYYSLAHLSRCQSLIGLLTRISFLGGVLQQEAQGPYPSPVYHATRNTVSQVFYAVGNSMLVIIICQTVNSAKTLNWFVTM
jgi:hypothetical protein